jgi:hypothetical protein
MPAEGGSFHLRLKKTSNAFDFCLEAKKKTSDVFHTHRYALDYGSVAKEGDWS